MMSGKYIMGVDPAIRYFGLSIHRVWLGERGFGMEPLWGQVIETRALKGKRKKAITQSSADFADFRYVSRELMEACAKYDVGMIAAEAPSWPRGHRPKVLMAAAWGILGTVCELLQLPLVEAQPMAIKREVTGNLRASKTQVMDALDERFPYLPQIVNHDGKNCDSNPDHFYDSVGAVWTCRDYNEVLAWLR